MTPDIIAIGASAGGVKALGQLLRRLPPALPASVLAVLHRSPYTGNHLAEVLRQVTLLRVRTPKEGETLEYGTCLISPPLYHLTIAPGSRVHLLADGFYRGHSIDALFTSLARTAGARSIGVILTGILNDGTLGLKAIKAAGGLALVQDPPEAAFASMPSSAITHAGPIDLVGSIDDLADFICRKLGRLPMRVGRVGF